MPWLHPIFADPEHHREKIFRRVLMFSLFSIVLWIVGVGMSLYFVGTLSGLDLVERRAPIVTRSDPLFPQMTVPDGAGATDSTRLWPYDENFSQKVAKTLPLVPDPTSRGLDSVYRRCEESGASTVCDQILLPDIPVPGPPQVFAYLPYLPEWAYSSLMRHHDDIDALMPEWFRIQHVEDGLQAFNFNAEHQRYIAQVIKADAPRMKVYPVVGISPLAWEGAPSTAAANASLAQALLQQAKLHNATGICLHPDDPIEAGYQSFADFVAALHRALADSGMESCLITGRLDWTQGLMPSIDRLVLQGFEEAWDGSAPFALAAQPAFEDQARRAVATIGRDKLVLAIGNFSIDWSSGSAVPEQISFPEAMRRASQYDGRISFPPETLNTRIELTDESGNRHEIWGLDAVTAYNQLAVLRDLGVRSVGLWPLGFEDPDVWSLLGAVPLPLQEVETRLGPISLEYFVSYKGKGEFQHFEQAAVPGARKLSGDLGNGLIVRQAYTEIPRPYTIRRFANGPPDEIALTFDDGPDPKYTNEILDVLRDKGVPATFFLVGRQMLRTPGTVRRIEAEGHEIGSHTLLHPHLEDVSDKRVMFELNTAQRIIVSLTGHKTLLFREPYGRSEGPLTGRSARPLSLIDKAGYIIVGSEIVPPDWTKISADELVAFVQATLDEKPGNVIVMHDGGGDRSATVAALPQLIDMLRADGYRFVSLATLLGTDRDGVMPPEKGARAAFDSVTVRLLAATGDSLIWIFWIVIFVGAARSLNLLLMAHLRRHYPVEEPPYTPSVTVVIPAYNEEAVIVHCVETVLASDYPDLQVIVVDDGSVDHTYDLVTGAYADDSRITVIREENQGKWKALDTAYSMLGTEIVVAIDADTVVKPDAIRLIVRAFRDPAVGAVAGNVKVGNRTNLITRLQALEYITMQNIDRRAMEFWRGILVVPGALGAWRSDAVREAGLYTNQTLTEDADLTVAVQRAGYRVMFEERAVSITEAPQNVRSFLRQRLRWTLGMMQTAWKHRRATVERHPVGLISIPDLWLFGVLLPLLAPFADMVFLAATVGLVWDMMAGVPLTADESSVFIVLGYAALPMLDLLTALAAFRFERTEKPWLALLFPFQRFFYRQLLYFTLYRAVIRAFTGRLAAWGKLVRLGTVRLPQQ